MQLDAREVGEPDEDRLLGCENVVDRGLSLAQSQVLAVDPAGGGGLVWISNSHIPAPASFSVPFQVGDRITGLVFAAYGNGSAAGLKNIKVVYQPDEMSSWQILAMGEDLGRKAQWGQVEFAKFQPTVLDVGAICWVQFDVTEAGYYIGMVTPVIERPCLRSRN